VDKGEAVQKTMKIACFLNYLFELQYLTTSTKTTIRKTSSLDIS